MLPEKTPEEEIEAYGQAIQVAPIEYAKKLTWLSKKWREASDSEVRREIGSIGSFPPYPVTAAIIADNMEYFWDHYQEEIIYCNLTVALERACLFGSPKIAESILDNLKSSFTKPEHNYLLGYICASNNEEWMEKTALAMIQAGIKKVPKSIYSNFVDGKIMFKICDIFRAGKLPDNLTTSKEPKSKRLKS